MSRLLPEDFVMDGEEYTNGVTVEDVLSHRSGLPAHDFSYFGSTPITGPCHPNNSVHLKPGAIDTPKSITRNLRNLPTNQPIRSKWQYCNLMFTVATHLVETLTQKPFAEGLQEWFFEPLGMTSTHLQPQAAIDAGLLEQMAVPYHFNEKTESYTPIPWLQSPEAQGAGSIYSSAADYAKYIRAIMMEEAMFHPKVRKGLTRPRIIENPEDEDEALASWTSFTAYAAGWDVRWYRGHLIISHEGLNYGFGSVHFFLPRWRFGGVVVGNSEGANGLACVVMRELVDGVVVVEEKVDWNQWVMDGVERGTEQERRGVGELRAAMIAGGEGDGVHTVALEEYVGEYWNDGTRV
ncbi:hypothetical protein LTR62_003614 [Meristemomyces frigidus]|uniref:Beta-lactamase-related domain-containing protein n=1 Tax=Meristemomyces frigidus TaxID=1508187 RepID=A0AAN7TG47_9PEZI|nr:hypothetical protein LTR62_003614 [Meristemomyces frigidus]